MNDLMIFEGNQVEIILNEKEKPLFEIYSTGMALGHIKFAKGKAYPRKERIDKDIKNAEISTVVQLGQQYFTEETLYDFMLECKTEKCKPFRKWVVHEVLPQIRKTGNYISNNAPMISNKEIQEFKEDVKYIRSQVCIKKKDSMLYTNMIKEYLGIKTIKEDKYGYNFIKKLFLLKVGVDKFEDIEVNADNLIMLNECCRCYKLPYEQISLF